MNDLKVLLVIIVRLESDNRLMINWRGHGLDDAISEFFWPWRGIENCYEGDCYKRDRRDNSRAVP